MMGKGALDSGGGLNITIAASTSMHAPIMKRPSLQCLAPKQPCG